MTVFNYIVLLLFIPTVLLICEGIWHEEKWIAFEQKVWRWLKFKFKKIKERIKHERKEIDLHTA